MLSTDEQGHVIWFCDQCRDWFRIKEEHKHGAV